MKKLLTLAAAAIISLSAAAENMYVGGNLGFWRDGTEHKTNAHISAELGYNLTDNFAVGGALGWKYAHTHGVSGNLFNINPYVRYTFVKWDLVSLFVDGGVDLGIGKTSYKDGDDSDTAFTYGIGFKPGVALNLNDHCSFVAHFGFLGYNGMNDAAEDQGYHKSWGLDFSSYNLSLGFYYNF